MNHISKLSIVLLPLVLAGCASYESRSAYSTTVPSAYSTAPYPYYSSPPAYYYPAPVYVVPAPAPVYAVPGPSFSAHIQSGPHYVRPDRHRHRHGRRPDSHEEPAGNAAESRIGGPGWGGTVWKR